MPDKLLMSDVQLIGLLKADDEAALTIIYKRYWASLFSAAYNILKDKQACEDIIQELFIKLWDCRAEVVINVSLKAYLYASVRYGVYRQIKTGSVRSEIFDDLIERLHTPTAYGSIEHKELLLQINRVIDTLPEKCREVYKLSREECLSHKQIAMQLNISTKTVENHLTKALRELRGSLGAAFIMEALMFLLDK
ncbi:RNA polymerase sigma-70 factor (ECF subfamily) [Mucilaginibacter oryzae]|uniref:RNA polymerase sigma-70 factor (ECF subfamily) n=1 Tax=Mucilaginibacter oryzae TaxID=468058 RepID=A0A316HJS5_9SPHI|nr:RNA polymerase sigma-70 factor [Mucilaginibacter oryzae]PWK78485.1 RNA polymerase sigma-70 factor (ECF subfamily) [Mucilaginibacter oryzae]